MTSLRIARMVARTVAVIVLVASGAYFIVYLYRWEWNRAQISGLIFIAAELAVLGSVLLGRLRVIEDRVQAGSPSVPSVPPPPTGSAVATVPSAEANTSHANVPRATDPQVNDPQGHAPHACAPEKPAAATPAFPWLDRTSVFIPVLLGAGAILAALAYVVERVAAYITGSNAPPSTRLSRIAYPEGGLAGMSASGGTPQQRPAHPRWARNVVSGITVILLALLLVAGVNTLADYTMSRPDDPLPGATRITLDIGYKSGDPTPVEQTAIALFEACRLRVPHATRFVQEPTVVGGRTVQAVLEPALGPLASRRLRGCLEDATLDGVVAHVREMHHVA